MEEHRGFRCLRAAVFSYLYTAQRDLLRVKRTAFRSAAGICTSVYLDQSGGAHSELFPRLHRIFRRGIRMEILYAAIPSKEVRSAGRRDSPGHCVGTLASACRFLLLYDAGYGTHHGGIPAGNLYFPGYFPCLGVHEDEQHLGAGHHSFFE